MTTPMTKELTELRKLATALDGDKWHSEGSSVYGSAYDVGDNLCYDHIVDCESIKGESPVAEFIAAANPATVLALLDALEASERRIAELEREIDSLATVAGNNAAQVKELQSRAESAEQRAAQIQHDSQLIQCWVCFSNVKVSQVVNGDGHCPICGSPIDIDDEPYSGSATLQIQGGE